VNEDDRLDMRRLAAGPIKEHFAPRRDEFLTRTRRRLAASQLVLMHDPVSLVIPDRPRQLPLQLPFQLPLRPHGLQFRPLRPLRYRLPLRLRLRLRLPYRPHGLQLQPKQKPNNIGNEFFRLR
jgi:hypothetical protein